MIVNGLTNFKRLVRKQADSDAFNMTGVRLLFNTTGIGYTFSISRLMFQIAITAFLFILLQMCFDFYLLNSSIGEKFHSKQMV